MAFVTDDELWVAIGRALRDIREAKGWFNVIDVQNAGHGHPNYATVQKHERGQLKTFAMLSDHTKALGMSVADLFAGVLAPILNEPLTREAMTLVRLFEHQLSVKDRTLLLATADRLAGPETPASNPGSGPGHARRAHRKR